jgi:raffinose/stachyose/melibiose transport system permease protein
MSTRAAPLETTRARDVVAKRRLGSALTHAVLLASCAFAVVPVLLAVLASFKTLYDFYDNPLGLPATWAWQNYVQVWNQAHIPEYALNSAIVAGGAVPTQALCSCLVAYGLARFRFAGNQLVFWYVLAGLLVPIQLTILPIVLLLKTLGILNTHLGLIIPYATFGMPFSIFLLTGFMRALPRELEEAARIDGAGELRIFWSIMLPLTRPALATIAILHFVGIWNDLFFPLVSAPDVPLLQVGVQNLRGVYSTQWGYIFAGVVLSALPLITLYVLLTKQFIRGLSAGAIKG